MIKFNKDDRPDIKQQIEYLNNKGRNLQVSEDYTKTFDFFNDDCIVEYKRRNCNHDTWPDFILEKFKFDANMEIANNKNIKFYYQNRFNDGKGWEWDITDMVKNNTMPEIIEEEMNQYTYVDNPQKIIKKIYMLKLDMGYEI